MIARFLLNRYGKDIYLAGFYSGFLKLNMKQVSNLFTVISLLLNIVSICILLMGITLRETIFSLILIFAFWICVFALLEMIKYQQVLFRKELNFLGLFFIQEFTLILETTQSSDFALNYFLKLFPPIFRNNSVEIIIHDLIEGKRSNEMG